MINIALTRMRGGMAVNIIEKLMKEHGLTPVSIAKRLKITEAYCSMLINGKRKISKPLALKIRKEFEMSLDDIFFAEKVNTTTSLPTTETG